MKELLSKKALRTLADNGYQFKREDDKIILKKKFDYIAIIVIAVITLIVGFPLFLVNGFLGLLTLVLGMAIIFIRQKYFAKKMLFEVDLSNQKFDFFDHSIELERQSLSFASKIILHSKYVDEYTSSFKSTSEEHQITISIQLLSGSVFTLFYFHSDYAKPSEEILEVYKLIKKLIRWTKKKAQELEDINNA